MNDQMSPCTNRTCQDSDNVPFIQSTGSGWGVVKTRRLTQSAPSVSPEQKLMGYPGNTILPRARNSCGTRQS